MPFRSIVGHHHVLALLARAVARESLPPSLILSGQEGVGKHRAAVALAQVVNCLKPVPGERATHLAVDACGVCAACRRIARGIHPDVVAADEKGVHPEVVDVDVKETSAIIPVDVARKLIRLAGYRPYEARRRFLIFDPADAMEWPAQNALLKLLEEPPPATVVALVTARPDALLPTVRSRCPQIRFGPLTAGDVAAVLQRELKVPEREARAAASVAGGSVARAIEMTAGDITDARGQALEVLREAASGRDRSLVERLQAPIGVEKRQGTAAAEREQVTLALRALSSLLRDLVLMVEDGDRADLANADLQADLEPLKGAFGRERARRAFAAAERALDALRGNASAKLVVDWLAFQV